MPAACWGVRADSHVQVLAEEARRGIDRVTRIRMLLADTIRANRRRRDQPESTWERYPEATVTSWAPRRRALSAILVPVVLLVVGTAQGPGPSRLLGLCDRTGPGRLSESHGFRPGRHSAAGTRSVSPVCPAPPRGPPVHEGGHLAGLVEWRDAADQWEGGADVFIPQRDLRPARAHDGAGDRGSDPAPRPPSRDERRTGDGGEASRGPTTATTGARGPAPRPVAPAADGADHRRRRWRGGAAGRRRQSRPALPRIAISLSAAAAGGPGAGLAVSGPGPGAEVARPEGVARIHWLIVSLALVRFFRAGRLVQPLIALGVGAQDVRARGTSAMPAIAPAHDGHAICALASVGGGLAIAFGARLAAVVEVEALLFRPSVTIEVGLDAGRAPERRGPVRARRVACALLSARRPWPVDRRAGRRAGVARRSPRTHCRRRPRVHGRRGDGLHGPARRFSSATGASTTRPGAPSPEIGRAGKDGTLVGLDSATAWVAGGPGGGALSLQGKGHVVVPPSTSIASITEQVTVAAWIFLQGPVTEFATALSARSAAATASSITCRSPVTRRLPSTSRRPPAGRWCSTAR